MIKYLTDQPLKKKSVFSLFYSSKAVSLTLAVSSEKSLALDISTTLLMIATIHLPSPLSIFYTSYGANKQHQSYLSLGAHNNFSLQQTPTALTDGISQLGVLKLAHVFFPCSQALSGSEADKMLLYVLYDT